MLEFWVEEDKVRGDLLSLSRGVTLVNEQTKAKKNLPSRGNKIFLGGFLPFNRDRGFLPNKQAV